VVEHPIILDGVVALKTGWMRREAAGFIGHLLSVTSGAVTLSRFIGSILTA
jgi:hypothetical protein